jgi:hypothetical protein
MLSLDPSLQSFAHHLQPLVRQEVVRLFTAHTRPVPEFLAQLTTDVAVHHVLTKAQAGLLQRGAPPEALLRTAPSEFGIVWGDFASRTFEIHRLRDHPTMPALIDDLVAMLVSGIYNGHSNRVRNRTRIASGPPPAGLPSFPEYTRGEKVKSREVPFERYVLGHVTEHSARLRQHLESLPRRQASGRAT